MTTPITADTATSFGCAWGDYDTDGYLDLFVANGLGDANALYHNNGDGTFTRIATNAIATNIGDSSSPAWGDYDNDGDLDVFVTNWDLPSFLFRNDGDQKRGRTTETSWARRSSCKSGPPGRSMARFLMPFLAPY